MKKYLGITFGGLQKRAILLVLSILIISTLLSTGINLYQSKMLTQVVGSTRVEQQEAISKSSSALMYQVLENSQVSSTALQANVVDNDMAEVVDNLAMLRSMAQGILTNRDALVPVPVSLPDPAQAGTVCAYALAEEGVDYTASQSLGLVAHLATPMIAMRENNLKIEGCYIGLADGTDFCVDDKPENKYDDNGKLRSFPVRQRPWYTGAVETGGVYFTGVVPDAFSGRLMITASAPVVVEGEIAGVVGIDVVLSSLGDFIDATTQGSYAYVVNGQGEVILGSKGGPFTVELAEEAPDLRQDKDPALAAFVSQALTQTTDVILVTREDKDYFMVGSPMPTVGWTVISVVERALVEAPTQQLLEEYDRINESATGKFREGTRSIQRVGYLLLVLMLAIGVVAAFLSTRRMVKPIESMTRDIVHSSQTGVLFEMKDSYRTNDEIELLAEAFDDLSKKTKAYIQQITDITRETERVHTELTLANRIQESMLPSIFPPFPGRPEFDLYASMDPAKEVGGDFYDFFLVDDDHLCVVIADVSGKGIPAALFMMISKVIVQSCAMLGRSAAEILNKTNEALCTNNQVDMFVTVWLGILEISTGRMTCANAGHEYPVLKQPGGDFTLLKDKHGLVVGGLEGMTYSEYKLQLEPGAKLFVYTDGVPEATNAQEELFGLDRMLTALNQDPAADPKQVLKNVRTSVDTFVGEAEQFDDLTMLCLEYRGGQKADGKETADRQKAG